MIRKKKAMTNCEFEVCPHCESENEYDSVPENEFKVRCKFCGREIMLCNKCYEQKGICDWHKTPTGEKCFRGETKDENA